MDGFCGGFVVEGLLCCVWFFWRGFCGGWRGFVDSYILRVWGRVGLDLGLRYMYGCMYACMHRYIHRYIQYNTYPQRQLNVTVL